MFGRILSYGTLAGLIVGIASSGLTVGLSHQLPSPYSMVIGYLVMLIALSAVFAGIKRHRDVDLGGVIRFWPAFALGIGIAFVASVFYVVAWEATVAVTHMDFAGSYANFVIDEQKAKGVSGEALARLTADMEQFKIQYANPLYRLPMTFIEIFPVGLLVSVISAGLLRSSRFLPAQR